MKKTFTLFAFAFLCKFSFAQVMVATAEYNKLTKPALLINIPYTSETVSGAIIDTLNKLGYKSSKDKDKDYIVFKGVRLAALGEGSYDLYFNTDRMSKREKDKSTLYMLISKGYDNFVSDETDHNVIEGAKNFLNGLTDMTAAYDLELQIKDQQETLQKAERKLQSLKNDADDLQKKKQKIEQDIADNQKAQIDQQSEIEKQKGILGTLIGKRKI